MKKNLILLIILAVLGGVAWYAWKSDAPGTLSDEPLADFTIEDTASITKIFITDVQQNSVTLERVPGQRLWKLNSKYFAKQSSTDLLLKTFKRMKVRSSVPYKAKENVLRIMAASGRKVEVYAGGDEPVKIYYVGTSTQDHNGTHMVLEVPGIGRSPEPYIVYMEGFTGYLTTRFHANEEEWRYTGIFEFPELNISDVQVKFNEAPSYSFHITYGGGNNLALYDLGGNRIPAFDTSALKNYFLLYKKVHFESFNSFLSPMQEDSLKRTTPSFSLEVTDNSNNRKRVDLFWKKASKEVLDENGKPFPMDLEYMYGVTDDGDVVLCQHFVFDPLLQPLETFLPR